MKNKIIIIKVTFTEEENKEYDSIFEFIIEKSSCFEYGNGTQIRIKRKNEKNKRIYPEKLLDTRYIRLSEPVEYCLNWLKYNYLPHKAEIISVITGEEIK